MNKTPSIIDYKNAVVEALRKTLKELFKQHDENFYYITVVMTGDANPPVFSAWSTEALERVINSTDNPQKARFNYEWSYADSPYLGYRNDFFEPIHRLCELRQAIFDKNPVPEHELRMNAVVESLQELDQAGTFGNKKQRSSVVVLAEIVPPDHSNTIRAKRLNPPSALSVWLSEVAE